MGLGGTTFAAEFDPAIGKVGANSAAEVSSLSQVQIPLRKLFLPVAGTTAAFPYRRINFRCEICTCYKEGRKIYLLICYSDREEQFPQRDLFL